MVSLSCEFVSESIIKRKNTRREEEDWEAEAMGCEM
jgi:hypothetical protein